MENKFLKSFDKVKKRFNNKIKDELFPEEIEAFKKYTIIDDNNMFNYIYTHNIYQLLIENPNEYKINIISKNKEELSQFKAQLFKEDALNLINNNFAYETYLNFNEKRNNNLYNLYSCDKDQKKLLLTDKSLKEIKDHIIDNDENGDMLITTKDFKFNSYPSIKFIFYSSDSESINLLKENLEKNYKEENEKIKSIEKDILNKYFNNKNTLYINDQIYYRSSSLFSTMNIILYDDEDWEKNKETILDKIKINAVKGYKDIIINNIIYNINKNIMYYSDKDKEGDLFSSNSSYDGDHDSNLIDIIHQFTYTHFKNEMNFIKTCLLNFNSLINDHMKITYNVTNIDNNNDIGDFLKNNMMPLIEKEEETYVSERQKKYEDFTKNSKEELTNNLTNLKQEIDQKYFITNGSFDYLNNEILKWILEYEKQALDFLKEIDNLNINVFYDIKRILNNQGIYSINFDGLIKVVAVERISINDPIKNLIQKHRNSFGRILASFGLSGVLGGASSFLAGRAASVIGADAAAGTFGGPIGIGVGLVVGVGSFIGQAGYHYKQNRKLINSVYEDMNKSVMDTITEVEDSIKKEMDKIEESMEKDILEVKKFVDIIIDRIIKILAES